MAIGKTSLAQQVPPPLQNKLQNNRCSETYAKHAKGGTGHGPWGPGIRGRKFYVALKLGAA